ncbi:hypothetical protein FA95DRAFT_1033833 [Auriscalpium vulgare]|uniref:Uncharacterized protein n=1 Tax=Auriscalpium vulgare TaxID=40419 RepID=A0ACB8RY69_9AGAM|nr:hypothetical protein FA95DRAFT_1033833 [Auriscalpium vulgare]
MQGLRLHPVSCVPNSITSVFKQAQCLHRTVLTHLCAAGRAQTNATARCRFRQIAMAYGLGQLQGNLSRFSITSAHVIKCTRCRAEDSRSNELKVVEKVNFHRSRSQSQTDEARARAPSIPNWCKRCLARVARTLAANLISRGSCIATSLSAMAAPSFRSPLIPASFPASFLLVSPPSLHPTIPR